MKKKALIFDCDGVLWDGVLADGIESVNTALIEQIRLYANKGVIIGLCSKNDWSTVDSMLRDGIKLLDYISVYRINWKDKVSNLKEIAKELNIGLDALVMVDDSEFEISLIRDQLPEVMAIYPDDLISVVAKYFDLTGDFSKTKQYKENYRRAKAQEEFTNIDDFLASLNMVLTIKINDTSQTARISELTMKTNQFNLTTERIPEERIIKALMQYPSRVYSMSVKDRFGDNGLTGVCILRGNTIHVFLLSCRILGRGIEYAFMDYIIANLEKAGYLGIVAVYRQSDKNGQVRIFYDNCGFKLVNETTASRYYSLLLKDYKNKAKNHFKYE